MVEGMKREEKGTVGLIEEGVADVKRGIEA